MTMFETFIFLNAIIPIQWIQMNQKEDIHQLIYLGLCICIEQ